MKVIGSRIIDPRIDSFGWKTYLQQRRGTSKITVNKLIATGVGLEKGQALYCYLAKDNSNRQIIVVYLDGKQREK